MTRIRIAIHGAAGRMGQRLVALGHADPELDVVAALERRRIRGWGKTPAQWPASARSVCRLADKLEAAQSTW